MKKLLRVLVWIAGIVLLLVIVAVVAVKIFFPAEKVRQMAIERGSEALGRPVSVEGIDISIWGGLGVELVDVTIGSPETVSDQDLLQAENIDLKLRLFPLLSSEFRIDRLIINSPRIVLVKASDGRTNHNFKQLDSTLTPQAVKQLPSEAKAAAAAVSFDALEINDGQLSYRDDSSGVQCDIRDLNLSTALENPALGEYLSQGKIDIGSLGLTLDKTYPVITVGLNYRGKFDFNSGNLSVEKADLQVNGLKFTMTAEVEDALGVPKARASIKSDQIAVANLFQLLPDENRKEMDDFKLDGDFSLDADLEYDGSLDKDNFSYRGSAVISDMAMSKTEIRGELRFRRALLDFKPDNVRLNIEEGTFDGQPFMGHLVVDDFDDPRVNGELGGTVNLAFAQPFLPVEGKHELDGMAEFDLKLSGRIADLTNMSFSGNLATSNGKYNSLLLPEAVESFSVDAYFDNSLVHVRKLEAGFKSGNINFAGRIDNLVPYLMSDSNQSKQISPAVDGALDGELDLAFVNRFLPTKGNPALTGRLAIDLKFAGDASQIANFQPRGKMSISDATYTDSLLPEPITDFSAELTISPDTISVVDMQVKFVSSDVSFAGKLIDPFPYLLPLKNLDRSRVKKPLFLFEFSSTRFDVDKLFPEAVPGAGESHAVKPMDSVSIMILPDIDGRGTLLIDTLIYTQIEFTSIEGNVRIKDRRIECYNVTGDVYSGKVSGKTTIDLSDFEDPIYTGEFEGSQIEVNDFVSRFTKFKGRVFGQCDLSGNYNARGWDPDAFLNSLNMTAMGAMHEGKLVTSGAVYSLMKGLADKTGQTFSKEQPLKNLSSNIVVKDGKVALDNMRTHLGNLGDIELSGFYGFDGSLEYSGTLELTRDMTTKLTSGGGLLGGLAGLLTDKSSERLRLPLKITGTVDSPIANLDYSAISKAAGNDLKDKAGGLLEGLLKKKKE
jgi:hypothetical protein